MHDFDRLPAGPTDSLTDVTGLSVGHYTETRRPTGCTVVLCPEGAVAGVDVRGAAPGTRETDLLDPVNTVDRVHGVLLSGGSAFGLAAAQGVVDWLHERGHGLPAGPTRVPIVPAAILFDLWMGNPSIYPDGAAGRAACEAAHHGPVAQGSVGAGTGASVGKCFGMAHAMKGGIGSASLRLGGITVAALIAVNAVGDVRDPRSGRLIAGARAVRPHSPSGRPVLRNTAWSLLAEASGASNDAPRADRLPGRGEATTIGVVATDAVLDKAGCTRLARVAHDGLARAIDPVHTAWDGDTLFALSTGHLTPSAPPAISPMVLAVATAWVTAMATARAVLAASRVQGEGVPDLPITAEL
ncbi:MAG: P1 family peptidase [Burkholderiaceae bacterium]